LKRTLDNYILKIILVPNHKFRDPAILQTPTMDGVFVISGVNFLELVYLPDLGFHWVETFNKIPENRFEAKAIYIPDNKANCTQREDYATVKPFAY
jgi:hypothetical protein